MAYDDYTRGQSWRDRDQNREWGQSREGYWPGQSGWGWQGGYGQGGYGQGGYGQGYGQGMYGQGGYGSPGYGQGYGGYGEGYGQGGYGQGQRYGGYGGYGGYQSGYTGGYTGRESGYGYGQGSFGTGQESRGGYGGTQQQRQWGQYAGRGPKGYRRSDDRIREDVSDELTRHPDVDATEIEVRVENAEVTLVGIVEDRHQKRLAEDLAERVPGVNDVHNQLRARRGLGEKIAEAITGRSAEERERDRERERETAGTRGRAGR